MKDKRFIYTAILIVVTLIFGGIAVFLALSINNRAVNPDNTSAATVCETQNQSCQMTCIDNDVSDCNSLKEDLDECIQTNGSDNSTCNGIRTEITSCLREVYESCTVTCNSDFPSCTIPSPTDIRLEDQVAITVTTTQASTTPVTTTIVTTIESSPTLTTTVTQAQASPSTTVTTTVTTTQVTQQATTTITSTTSTTTQDPDPTITDIDEDSELPNTGILDDYGPGIAGGLGLIAVSTLSFYLILKKRFEERIIQD